MRSVVSWISFATVVFVLLLPPSSAFADPGEKATLDIDPTKPIVVSMGDSYSSGEGCSPFYGSRSADPSTGEFRDWVAHRSENSWPGKLTIGRTALADLKDGNWLFVASSGAVASNIYKKPQEKKYYPLSAWEGLLDSTAYKTAKLPCQDYIFDVLEDNGVSADVVTLTIGGNDIGFGKTMTALALQRLDPASVWHRINQGWSSFNEGGAKKRIEKAYRDVLEKAGKNAHVLVVGYPLLLAEKSTALWEEGYAKLINNNVHRFNKELDELADSLAVEQIGSDRITFVDVEDAFGGEAHGAYADDGWINEIMPKKSEDLGLEVASAYSIHPNWCGNQGCGIDGPDCGMSAYADAVQEYLSTYIPDESREDGIWRYRNALIGLDDANRNDPRRSGTTQEMLAHGADYAEKYTALMDTVYDYALAHSVFNETELIGSQQDWQEGLEAALVATERKHAGGTILGVVLSGKRIDWTHGRIVQLLYQIEEYQEGSSSPYPYGRPVVIGDYSAACQYVSDCLFISGKHVPNHIGSYIGESPETEEGYVVAGWYEDEWHIVREFQYIVRTNGSIYDEATQKEVQPTKLT